MMSKILIFVIILQAFFVILSKNPVTSVLFLISIYILTAALFLILGAEFLSILLVIVYVGAVAILFLFVVMMLNIRIVEVYDTIKAYVPLGAFIGFFFFFEFFYILQTDFSLITVYTNDTFNNSLLIEGFKMKNNLNLIAEVLFNYYYILIWFAGILLLMAMLGAVALTLDPVMKQFLNTETSHFYLKKQRNSRIVFWKVLKKKKCKF